MTTDSAYLHLCSITTPIRVLEGIVSLLDWDQETYMPVGAAAIRATQLQTMAGFIHREKRSKRFIKALSRLIDLKSGTLLRENLSPSQFAALREWRRDYLRDKALPSRFVERFAAVTSRGIMAWRAAKQTDDFSYFAPVLEEIVTLCRKKADLIGYEAHPYDALLDHYEPDLKSASLVPLFSRIRQFLTPLIQKIVPCVPTHDPFIGHWDPQQQSRFGEEMLRLIGYDFTHGRIDLSAHPFSSASHPTDSRITSRLHADSLMSHLFVLLHEFGHALYEMQLPSEAYGTPLGDARSLGIHESQSRFWETQIGLSRPFWQYFFPRLQQTFTPQLDSLSFESFYRALHHVKPSPIRVEADELTYPLHIVLRFEIEMGLISGEVKVRDLPEVWRHKMEELLGITPPNDAQGCLQDIHWAMGGFGYFPTYTLGSAYAAHLFKRFTEEHFSWEKEVARGVFQPIIKWLWERIHKHGKCYSTDELLHRALGSPFSIEPYLDSLHTKYSRLFS